MRWPQYAAYFEPLTLLSGLAAMTSHIGLVATMTTSFNEPFNVARRFASLDHISGGRSGWNVVTSANAAEPPNFGEAALTPHGERYRRAYEFVQIVKGLWDSWDDDAFLRDRTSGVYFDPAKLHTLAHKGEFYSVKGPLHVARPPQGHPVIVQASASDAGREMAAEMAEIVFSQQQVLAAAQAFYKDMKERAASYGRRSEDILILPGLNPIVGRTAEEAEEKHEFLQSQIHPDVGRAVLSIALGGLDVSNYPLDEPLPPEADTFETEGSKSAQRYTLDMARKENLTLRQLYLRYCGARGQRTVKGTAAQIADQMEEWFTAFAVDGFLVQPAYLPGGLDDFSELVMPELRRRGLVRREYEGKMLRDNLGLRRPASRYAASSGSDHLKTAPQRP
jgi:FMN-dependent oxidoreductase (nitrilotriacetate monooxygenase family)